MRDLRAGVVVTVLAAVVIFALLMRTAYFANPAFLGELIIAQLMLLAVARYKKSFFPLLLLAFLWAGIDLPFRVSLLYARWFVLGVAAVVGLTICLRERHHHFGLFHLVALFCSLSAVVSALVSAFPQESVLKAMSLLLLFVYAATGGRLAVPPFQPELFFARLVVGCEVFNGFTAIAYLLLRWQFFGNPNSLGAVMGIVIVPLLMWGFMTAESVLKRHRLAVGLMVASVLLLSSLARAAIGAAAVACFFLCIGLRQYRLLAKAVALSFALAVLAVMIVPEPGGGMQLDQSEPLSARFLYKGHAEGGVFASRRSVWHETFDVIKANPWFGSGFGTSVTSDDISKPGFSNIHIDSWIIREHGNSYLAIAEWVGLLGVVPFYALVLLAVINVGRVLAWMRRTGDALSPAIPAAAVIAAGLVHAGFEDWMFAVGYYVSIFYWTMAFILVDLIPRKGASQINDIVMFPEPQLPTAFRTAL
jgi:O-antigen ligase